MGIQHRKPRDPRHVKARQLVNDSIKLGKMKSKPCEICGAPKAQAHHVDYLHPLIVMWLCALCHKQFSKIVKGKN